MVVAAMQPYFFPYIGYFQLMAACDLFVIRDDAQFIAGGWVNRNRILVGGMPRWITMPVARAPHHLPIKAREYLLDHPLARRIRRRIVAAYEGAPYFAATMVTIDEALSCQDANVAEYNTRLLAMLARRLGINTPVCMASGIGSTQLRGEQRVIEICIQVEASTYVNPVGGAHLYDRTHFAEFGVMLRFLRSCAPAYRQFGDASVSSLSVIDVMMFNDASSIAEMIRAYHLVSGPEDTSDVQRPKGGAES